MTIERSAAAVNSSIIILPLSSADATFARAGGKGANLAILVRAGFDVPPGFIVTTDAYRAFLTANQIEPRLLAGCQPAILSPDDPGALDAASETIRVLFTGGRLPADIAAAIQAAYAALASQARNPPAVAVRSSATAEDLPGLSFAGQQETYLNIASPDALMEAVKACWGSLWTARAMAYRARNHIAPEDVALAVVVQVMVPSEVSGVLFTANPLTGHRGEMVIDASFGLGEAIVSGQVAPDRYVVAVQAGAMHIASRKLGAKALAILPRAAGGTETVSRDGAAQQALPDEQILELARIGARVADHSGSPQDIEWAWAGGRLYLLQSRPITSLYPLPESILRSDRLRVFFSLSAVQGVVEPFTPMGLAMFSLIAPQVLRTAGVRRSAQDVMITAGERLCFDVTDLLRDRRLSPVVQTAFANVGPGARDAVRTLIADGRIQLGPAVGADSIRRLVFRLRTVLAGAVLAFLCPAARRARAVRKADQYIAAVRQALQEANSLEAHLALIDQVTSHMLQKVIFTVSGVMVPGLASQAIVGRWLTAWAGAEPGAVRRLLRGLPGNVTTEMDLRLSATAQAIRSDTAATAFLLNEPAGAIARAYHAGELPPVAQRAIKAFLDEYGMRAVGEIDIGRPRWREDPQSIIQNLCSYLQIDDPNLAPDRVFQRAAAEAERLAAEFIEQVRQQKGALRAHLLATMIARMRLLAGLREMPKFTIIRLFDLLRSGLLASGQALAAQGRLEQTEDIFFVPLETLRAVARGDEADLKAIVCRERAEYARELTRRQIPQLLLSTGEVFYESAGVAGTSDLVGDGVSPGTVEGKVRVILDPRGVRLEPGEILVCPATDPGWTPLFLSAGGLVMELGGMMTHGSVVAREYGIPAVVGVRDATRRLRTGDRVRVDGSAGRVVVLP